MKTIIIGGVAGGASAATRLRRLDESHEIVVLEAGRVVERGPHAELLARGGRYAEMWRLQQSGQEG